MDAPSNTDSGEEASEDDVDRAEKNLDSMTKAHTEQIDKMLATKESELLTI